MNEICSGIKTIQIAARTRYPIISAYEFEYLKTQEVMQELIKPCTIYFIIQRPLTYIDNLYFSDGHLHFHITDYTSSRPLVCRLDSAANGISDQADELLVEVHFYRKPATAAPPYRNVAAFKFFDTQHRFLGWFSPQMFLYGFLSGTLEADVEGNIRDYLEYDVHYIGKAFSQSTWDRLTGHEKLQSILTLEDALDPKARAPFEISLLMLEIKGFSENNIFPFSPANASPDQDPIVFDFTFEDDDNRFDIYFQPTLASNAEELTIETEAKLINLFKPKYNEVLFENYPNIRRGTRSAGYTSCDLLIEKIPAILKTGHFTQNLIIDREFKLRP